MLATVQDGVGMLHERPRNFDYLLVVYCVEKYSILFSSIYWKL